MSISVRARVLLVDDYPPFLNFVSSLLRQQGDVEVIHEVQDGDEAVRQAQSLKPDLILLDVGLPTLNGIEAAQQIRKLVPDSKVVFLSNECSREIVEEALNLGARGYIQKVFAAKDIPVAIAAVVNGGRFLSSTLAAYNLASVV
jgi:DNA-binding NarL/FixJ family response regulator